MIPKDLKYTKEHEWVRVEGDTAVFGITDHAQSQLGDITFVELPREGKEIKRSESISTVESVKAASDIYAPLSGKIVAANIKLQDNPEIINQDPYGNGWICKVKIADLSEMKDLMGPSQYEEHLKG